MLRFDPSEDLTLDFGEVLRYTPVKDFLRSSRLTVPIWVALLVFAVTCQRSSSAERSALQSYIGRYDASNGTVIIVREHGNVLALEVNYGSPLEFVPDTGDGFVHKKSGTKITFSKNDEGKVTELILHRGGQQRAKRIATGWGSEQVRTVSVNGTTYQTVISGEGKIPVVLVSGFESWAKVTKGLEGQARVVRFKPLSARKGAPFKDIATHATMLHQLLAKLEIAPPYVLVGHSFDGAVSRVYADLYPDSLRGLVLVDPTDERFMEWLKAHQPENFQLFKEQGMKHYVSDWEESLARLRASSLPKEQPVIVLTAGKRTLRGNDEFEKKIKPHDLEVASEVLIKAHRDLAATAPKGKHIVVPDTGHDIPKDQPGYVVDAVREVMK